MRKTTQAIVYMLFTAILAASCSQQEKEQAGTLSQQEKLMFLAEGKKIAQSSFAALSGQLKTALQAGGVPNAIDYCHVAAMPLTDSLSTAYEVSIRRPSLKNRNPGNKANALEARLIGQFPEKTSPDQQVPPILEADGDLVHFAAPIYMKAICLNCHGEPGKHIKAEDYALVKERYPQDKAIGYEMGDLRGIWHLTFTKKGKVE